MLPLWADRVYVAIAIDRIAILHVGGLPFKRRVVLQKTITLNPQINDSNNFDSIAVQLIAALKSLDIKYGNLEVMLSGQLVHLAMIQGFPKALSSEEQQRVMQVSFERIYGEYARKWHFRSQRFTYNQPVLAAAIDPSLLSLLQKTAKDSGLKLVSIEPAFSQLFNHWRKYLTKQATWLVTAERNYITISTLHGQKFTTIAQAPLTDASSSGELFTLIRREALKQGQAIDGIQIQLFAPHIASGDEPSNLNIQRLRLPVANSAKADSGYHLMSLVSQL